MAIRNRLPALLVSAALLSQPVAVQAQATAAAGRFVMALGAVQIQRGKAILQARNGTEIRQGDTIRTAPGSSAQIWLSDGTMVAIRERSEYRLDSYQDRQQANSDGGGAMGLISSIVKGGARMLTGAIGKANPSSVKVNTRVALIGIRGTGFDLVDCQDQCVDEGNQAASGLYGTVFEGQISVTNENGSENSDTGETFFLASRNAAVIRLDRQPSFLAEPVGLTGGGQPTGDVQPPDVPASVPPAPAPRESMQVEVRNIVGEVPATPPQQADALAVPTVTFNDAGKGDATPVNPSAASITLVTAEYNPRTGERNVTNYLSPVQLGYTNGQVTKITNRVATFTGYVIQGYTARQMEGGSDQAVVTWGRWADGTALIGSWSGELPNPTALTLETHQGLHWMVGETTRIPVPTGSYSFGLIGATTPTETRANALGGWAVTGGNLVADLNTAKLTGNLDLFASRTDGYGYFAMTFAGDLANAKASWNASQSANPVNLATAVNKLTGSLGLCTSTCNGIGQALFYGNDANKPASHAGITYDFNTGQGYLVQGVAVFGR